MRSRRPVDGNRLLLLSLLPFPVAVATVFLLIATIGDHVPRNLAAGASLALPGLVLTLLVMAGLALVVRRRWRDGRARLFSLVLSAISALMAWPVWTVGVLPSVNGMQHGAIQATPMRLRDLTISHASRSRTLYHWADLDHAVPVPTLGEGRYFVPQPLFERWQGRIGQSVTICHATGLLGAEIVLPCPQDRGSASTVV